MRRWLNIKRNFPIKAMQDHDLVALLLADSPKHIALVGEAVHRLLPLLSNALRERADSNRELPVSQYADIDAFIVANRSDPADDLAMCVALPAVSATDTADACRQLLGQACRAAPKRVLVEHPQRQTSDNLLGDEQFFAFGFRKLQKSERSGGLDCRWYTYSLSSYKQAPDWLNARFWANPERFDITD